MSRRRASKRHFNFGGYKGWLKGKENEEKFYCAFYLENFNKPVWLKNIRWATKEEDDCGIDFVAETYIKPERIFIQIKSSEFGRKNFWKKHSLEDFQFPIIVLVVDMWHYRYDSIRRLFFETANNQVFKRRA